MLTEHKQPRGPGDIQLDRPGRDGCSALLVKKGGGAVQNAPGSTPTSTPQPTRSLKQLDTTRTARPTAATTTHRVGESTARVLPNLTAGAPSAAFIGLPNREGRPIVVRQYSSSHNTHRCAERPADPMMRGFTRDGKRLGLRGLRRSNSDNLRPRGQQHRECVIGADFTASLQDSHYNPQERTGLADCLRTNSVGIRRRSSQPQQSPSRMGRLRRCGRRTLSLSCTN